MYFTEAELIGISTSSTPPLTVTRGGSIIKCYPNQAIANLHAAGKLKVGDRLMVISVDADFATAYAVDRIGTLSPAPGPASFELSGLTVSPAEVKLGEQVAISVTVKNVGGQAGSYTANFLIDGVIKTVGPYIIAAGESPNFFFTMSSSVVGDHTVQIGALTAVFKVTEAPPPPSGLTLTVAITPPRSGDTTPLPGTYPQTLNEYVKVVATPKSGYAFMRWEVIIGGKLRSYTSATTRVLISGNTVATAVFIKTA